jgi:hypothetical protein
MQGMGAFVTANAESLSLVHNAPGSKPECDRVRQNTIPLEEDAAEKNGKVRNSTAKLVELAKALSSPSKPWVLV